MVGDWRRRCTATRRCNRNCSRDASRSAAWARGCLRSAWRQRRAGNCVGVDGRGADHPAPRARSEPSERVFVSAEKCLDQAVEDLGAEVEVTTDLQATLPLPHGPLRVLLRNLLPNAVAAGAHHVHVAAVQSSRSWRLSVDDDGVGLAEVDRYAAGSGLGLSLSRRIAGRFGGALELAARPSGGTRATLTFPEAPA